jgi:hypothetical protein
MGHDGVSYAKQIIMRYADSGFKVFTYHGRDTHDDTDDAEYIKLQPGKSGSITMCEDSGSGGFVGIGTTRPKTLLHVNGCISGSIIRSKGDIIGFSSSDITLKDNLTKITNPIEKIQKLNGYEFDWNQKQKIYHGHDVGVVAQEVEKVIPEIVHTRTGGIKGVKYEKIIPLLIEAIKDQQEQIYELKKKLEEE